MDLDAYLTRVRERLEAAGHHVSSETIGGYKTIVSVPAPRSDLDRVDPAVTFIAPRMAATLSRASLDGYIVAARVVAKERQGRWGIGAASVGGGPMAFMPVVVTAGATPEAVEWAHTKRGLAFPVLVDIADGSVRRWRRAIVGAANARTYRKLVDSVFVPALKE